MLFEEFIVQDVRMRFCHSLTEGQKRQWSDYWQQCRHGHPRQHYLFGEVERAKGRVPFFAYAEIDGAIVCAGIFSIRPLFRNILSFEAVCLRGPIFDEVRRGREFLLQVIDYFKRLRVGTVRISPYWYFPEAESVRSMLAEIGFVPYGSPSPGESTGLIDLARGTDQLLASFSRHARYQIGLAGRLGVSVRPIDDSAQGYLGFGCLKRMRAERVIDPMSDAEFKAAFEHVLMPREYGIMLNSYFKDKFLGTLWIFRGTRIANPAGYAVEESAVRQVKSSLSIGPSLWWEGIKWAKEKGCSFLDVEGYKDNADPSDTRYLIYEFKRRLSPTPVHLLGQHVYVCCPPIHSLNSTLHFLSKGWNFAKGLPFRFRKKVQISKLVRDKQ